MRHLKQGRKLSRTTAHRTAMLRNLVCSLFLATPGKTGTQRVITTIQKAKEARVLAERVITLGKAGTLAARRHALALIGNRGTPVSSPGEPSLGRRVVAKVFSEIAPRYADRQGGYTRILRLAETRKGDNASRAVFELVGSEERAKSGGHRRRRAGAAGETKPAAPAAEAPAPESAPATTPEQEQAAKPDQPKPEA